MKYNPLFLLRLPESLEKNRENLPAKYLPSTKFPPICITLLRASLCAGGGVRGLVVLAEAGKRIFLRQLAVVAKQRFTTW